MAATIYCLGNDLFIVKGGEFLICHVNIDDLKQLLGQVDFTVKLCLSFCLELQSAKSTYQHVDLDL